MAQKAITITSCVIHIITLFFHLCEKSTAQILPTMPIGTLYDNQTFERLTRYITLHSLSCPLEIPAPSQDSYVVSGFCPDNTCICTDIKYT